MQYRTLGRTGMWVSPVCLGTGMFGEWGEPDHAACIAMVHRAIDAGINFIDSADIYSAGESERIVGEALSGGVRDDVILMTKGRHPMGSDPNQAGSSRRWLTRAVDDSLRRLDTDWIDVYLVHGVDLATDIDETLGVMSDLVRSGKVRAIGSSSFPPSHIVEAQWVAERRGRERMVVEQLQYSILARHVEAEALPTCEKYDLGVVVWGPLGAGWLTGRYRAGEQMPQTPRNQRFREPYDLAIEGNQRKLHVVEQLAVLAEKAGMTLVELALRFVSSHPAVTAPIVGTRSMEQLEGQLPAAGLDLESDLLDRIDELVAPGRSVNPSDTHAYNLAGRAGASRRAR